MLDYNLRTKRNNDMKHIQVFFQKTISDFKEDKKNNYVNFALLLCLISIPLYNFINSLFLALFFLVSARNFKLNNRINYSHFLLIILYVLFLFSWFWSVDKNSTQNALFKEIPLLLIPFCFLFSNIFFHLNRHLIIKYYSYSIFFYSFFFLIKAFFSFVSTNQTNVFFFHNLVSKDLNAIHFSVFVGLSFFYFLTKEIKKLNDYVIIVFLFLFLILLSSKNILFSTLFLTTIYFFYYTRSANKMRLRNIIILMIIFLSIFSFSLIKERLLFEFKIKAESNIGHTVINKNDVGSNIISMKEAWYNERFNQTDYFSGSSFRIYQLRLFFEILKEEPVFWNGLGLNASYKRIEEKGIKYNVFQGNNVIEGYQKKNFHNQYIQVFAEIGVFGFLILILILFINLKNALKSKDFTHIAFAVLMISLFLTESFLWRQRGVVFFTVFYCIFNSFQKNENNNK